MSIPNTPDQLVRRWLCTPAISRIDRSKALPSFDLEQWHEQLEDFPAFNLDAPPSYGKSELGGLRIQLSEED
jgi:hypothetical protein